MKPLNLDSLRVFQAVVSEGGVAQAAEKLHRVQSNVSTHIKKLEQRLGSQLFLRQGRRLALSPDGEVLLSYADQLLRLAEEAEYSLNSHAASGTFRLGTMESTAAARLPRLLAQYHAANPLVDMAISSDTSGSLVKRVLNYDIEAAFVAEPVMNQALVTRKVFNEELILLTPKSYSDSFTPSKIQNMTLIAFRPGCAYRHYFAEWLRQNNVAPKSIIEVSSYHAIVACVAAGAGVAVVPRSVLKTLSDPANLSIHKLPNPIGLIDTVLIWRQDYSSKKLDALIDILPNGLNDAIGADCNASA